MGFDNLPWRVVRQAYLHRSPWRSFVQERVRIHSGAEIEYTYAETAQLIGRILGKSIEYKRVPFDTFLGLLKSGPPHPVDGASARNLYGDLGGKPPAGTGDSFTVQHLRESAIDHQKGLLAGTNDLVERLGGRPSMTLEAFIEKHRAAFT